MTPSYSRLIPFVLVFFSLSIAAKQHNAEKAQLKHAITLYGKPKYSDTFTHFDYTNPDAPKGGELKQAAIGTLTP